MRTTYPFTAIVGQERMKRALILNAINPQIGGVLIRGERGTAKSTAARALAALIPEIEVVTGCRFGCNPNRPDLFCDECRERMAVEGTLPSTSRLTSFVDLPVSATEDRVVGTLDIEKAIQKGERHFEPGVLAGANRGLLDPARVHMHRKQRARRELRQHIALVGSADRAGHFLTFGIAGNVSEVGHEDRVTGLQGTG